MANPFHHPSQTQGEALRVKNLYTWTLLCHMTASMCKTLMHCILYCAFSNLCTTSNVCNGIAVELFVMYRMIDFMQSKRHLYRSAQKVGATSHRMWSLKCQKRSVLHTFQDLLPIQLGSRRLALEGYRRLLLDASITARQKLNTYEASKLQVTPQLHAIILLLQPRLAHCTY